MTTTSEYVLAPIREGPDFTLYRGRRNGDSSSVLAIALTAEHPSPQSMRRLEQEYALAAELDPAWAARPLAFTRHQGRMILVLEDPGGEPLDQILERNQGRALDLTRVLRIAIGLTAALGQMHRRGLIHKDIKPANVLVDDGSVRLTGFGIASRLPREHLSPLPPEIIAGTLAYMAPEQTGRMNRSMDARSDLYSLGVTLYQMLTGTLPFAAADPLEWVHCHLARQPMPPSARAPVPEPLSAITMKLLAKNAEERYQSASGLESDLRRCLDQWETKGHIDAFPLGVDEVPNRLLIPEKLYGREREIDSLLAAFDRVVLEGGAELVLISGYSGVGKSSLVNELHKWLVPPHGLFAGGKFDQYRRDIPYATLAQAFQALIRQILVKSEAEMAQWRSVLQDAVGPNGQLIVNLIPEVEFILGKQPLVPELPPREAQNRFQMVLRRFLGAFAQPDHPLALFLDDLQWLDAATLELLENLMTDPEVRHLLLVGAYRDNEVSSGHPLLRTLEEIRKAGARMRAITLAPLGLDDVGRLVADALHCTLEAAHPLAELVHGKTAGNPFFAIQFLTALAEEGLLWFDPGPALWTWDLECIRAKGYTDNVADLMVGKMKRLPATTQDALQQLACLGNVAEVDTLALVHGETGQVMHEALWEAARAGLVLREDSAYKFLHDRIQQAAYSLIPEEQRPGVHLHIGRALLAAMPAEHLAEQLFDVANQLNRGAALLVDHDEKVQVATIDLRAGRKAKASAAYAAARGYFAAGMSLLDAGDWSTHYELMFNLGLERAECEFLNSDFEQVEQILVELLHRGASKVDQAAAYHLKVMLHMVKSEHTQAADTALACLRLLDIDLPAHPTWEQVQQEYETVWSNLDGLPVESLINLRRMSDPDLQAAMRMLLVLSRAAYYTDFHLYCFLLCRTVNVSMRHGTSGVSANSFGYFGSILGPVFHRYREGYDFVKLACDLVEKHGFIASRPQVYSSMGLTAFWTQPLAVAIDFHRATFRAAIETGDLTFSCDGVVDLIAALLIRNDPLDAVWRESERGLEFVRKARFRTMADALVIKQRFIAAVQGRTAALSTFSDTQFDQAAFEAEMTEGRTDALACWYWFFKLQLQFLAGEYRAALAAANRAKPLLGTLVGMFKVLDYFYYTALTVAALYENASADERSEGRALLTAHQEQLREWADTYPPTFADKHALVSAEIARIEGRDADAMHLYEQAIQSAHDNGFIQNEALAHEVAARFYAARGSETSAHAHLSKARNGYERWGASAKVRQLDELDPRLREERVPASTTATIGTPLRELDVETVLKASQTLSSEIVLGNLIEKLMRIAVEHAGAERGLLVVLRGDEPQIAAETTTGQGRAEVTVRQDAVTPTDLPQSVLQYVIRTRERVVLDDASVTNLYAEDEYMRAKRARSVLCLPIVKQAKLIAALYLENNLTPCAFTSDRVALLEMLASQAAISLENANLYADLKRSEAFLAQGQSTSHTGSVSWNVHSGEIYWSEETYTIFEYDRARKPTLEFLFQRTHPDDRDLVRQTLDQATTNKTNIDLEHRLLMPDGSVKYLHVLARAQEPSPGDLEYLGAVMDVTAAKLAEQTLRKSEAYLAEAQRLSHTGSWAWNAGTGDIQYWSEECYRVLGFDQRRGLPRFGTFLQRIHPEDKTRTTEKLERAFRHREEFAMDYRIIHPGGESKDIHAIGHPVLSSSGDLIEFVGTVIDVTESKQAEKEREKLRQMQTYLAHFNRVTTMGELIASLAHDVNQPIASTVINATACLRWLQRDDPDLTEACAAAVRIVKDGTLAGEIIGRIRSQFHKETLQRESVDVNEVIGEMIALLHGEAARYHISIRSELAVDLPRTMGDRVQFQQVLMNLIVNGIDAMKGVDGTRELSVKSQRAEHRQLLVSVSDTGIGLPPQQAEQIFNAFFTTKPHGTGMGLRISRSIIESHGGRLWAADNFPRGATFQFTLSASEAAESKGKVAEAKAIQADTPV